MDETQEMTGKGRGRGWLKLDKVQEPGGLQQQINSPAVVPESAVSAFPSLPQYDKIVHTIQQFNADDDGILINQKFKYTLELIDKECRTEDDIRECFMYIYKKALHDVQFVNNFVVFTSLNSFRATDINNVKLRQLLLGNMQKDFENAAAIRLYNKNEFKNLIRLLGGFYERARLSCNNIPYNMLVPPIISCLDMLLDAPDEEDVELFARQMILNGAMSLEFLNQNGQKSILLDLFHKVRNLLINGSKLSELSRGWLMFSLDLCGNDFRKLPPDLHKFYQSKLGEKTVDNLQKSLNQLNIQTQQPTQTLDNCTTDVKVLSVDPQLKPHVNQSTEQKNHYHNKKPQGFNLHNSKDENTTEAKLNRKSQSGKAGRPILGAGARNNKDSSKENASGWDVKQKNTEGSGWGDKPLMKRDVGVRNNKGWEHDDRFDNDYS